MMIKDINYQKLFFSFHMFCLGLIVFTFFYFSYTLIYVCLFVLLFPSGEPPFQLYSLFLSDSLSTE